jgi:3',5'-cyclic AMP phosphodiesterase CpdA
MSATRIVHISDVHIGDAAKSLLDGAIQAIANLKPDLIVLSGDLTQAGRRREYAEAATFLAGMPAPILAAPGNHDAPVFDPWTRVVAPYKQFNALPVVDRWAGECVAAAAISTARALQARLDWSQGVYRLEALRSALAFGDRKPWRVVAAHHPPVTYAGAQVQSNARRGREALSILKARERTLLLCGHSHGFDVQPLGHASSAVIVAPTLASGRPREGGHGFVAIEFAADRAVAALHLLQKDGSFAETERREFVN